VVKTDERETARSAKESTSPKKHFGTEWELPLEPERAVTSEVRLLADGIRGTSHPANIPAADSGFETRTARRAVVGASKLLR
jgi:hypothetical protein